MRVPKKFILMIDCESTQSGKAFDFSFILLEKNGKRAIINQGGFVIRENCRERLFYNTETGFYGIKNLNIRTEKYRQLIREGKYSLKTTAEVNNILQDIVDKYGLDNLELMAYNISFDLQCCVKSGIILPNCVKIDLMKLAIQHFIYSAPRCYKYFRFALSNNLFSASKKNYISFSAQSIGNYVNQTPNAIEPHIGLFDLLEYELPIFCSIAKQKKKMVESKAIAWDSFITIQSAYNALHIN